MKWYFLCDSKPLPAAANMARDQYLLEQVESGAIDGAVLRIYQWAQPALSLGYHQKWQKSVDLERLEKHDVDLVRRWTGGRAVLHINEMTYSVTAPFRLPFKRTVTHNYNILAKPLKLFTDRLKLDARIAEGVQTLHPAPGKVTPCFASLSEAEIQTGKKKLIGSSQKLGKNGFLQHGSIPMEDHAALLSSITGSTLDMSEYMDTVGGIYRRQGMDLPDFFHLADALKTCFESVFHVAFQDLDSSLLNQKRINDLTRQRFSNREWTFKF